MLIETVSRGLNAESSGQGIGRTPPQIGIGTPVS
jgi:hypothetical protein